MKSNSTKKYFLDFLRIISCFSVINLHVAVNYSKDLSHYVESNMWSLMHLNSSFMLYAVPMFLVITGYIFLGLKKECTYRSILKYLIKYILIWIVVTPIFNMMEIYYNTREFTLGLVKQSYIDMIKGATWGHMWYLQTIFFIYLILPVFKPFFDKDKNDKDIIVFFIIFLCEIILIPLFNKYSFIKVYNHSPLESYLLYIFLGAVLYKYELPNTKVSNIIYGISLSLIIIITIYYNRVNNFNLLSGNFSILVFIIVNLIFTLAKNLLNNENIVITFIAKYTLDIYIYHVVFLHIFTKVLKIGFFVKGSILMSEYIFTFVIFVLSLIFSVIVKPIEDIIIAKINKILKVA